jgi:hypothetical protein
MKRRKRNSKLARPMFLCAAFAAMLFLHLDAKKNPRAIRWISDRDAMFDRVIFPSKMKSTNIRVP